MGKDHRLVGVWEVWVVWVVWEDAKLGVER